MMFVYILECADYSFYTGVTNNLERRLTEHETGYERTCYTYSRRPVKLVFNEVFPDPKQAISWEKQIKGWSRNKKKALIDGDYAKLQEFAICLNVTSHNNFIK
ncbi:MAG: GIY-YIG nuclease family protein [Bacteroidota bacterium]